jgi:hypothetical protein
MKGRKTESSVENADLSALISENINSRGQIGAAITP